MKEPFKSALPVLEKIEEAGYEASFVGGSVRDFLLGCDIHDVDIATSATPEEVKQIFNRTIDVGISHGTVIVLVGDLSFEVTSYRSETEYIDYRRPSEVKFIRSLQEDLARRDFTINAISMNRFGTIFDPFNGRKDIENRLIQTVGKADERFSEDALRMLRAVRFVSQLGFNLDSQTEQALRLHNHLLQHISIERVLMELDKLFKGDHTARSIEKLVRADLHTYILGLADSKQALERMASLPLAKLNVDEKWALLILLYKEVLCDQKDILLNLRLPKRRIQDILSLTKWTTYRSQSEWTSESLYSCGKETAISAEKLCACLAKKDVSEARIADIVASYEQLPIHSLRDICVGGHDLKEWLEAPSGPWIKDYLQMIESLIVKKELENNRDAIKMWVMKCNQN